MEQLRNSMAPMLKTFTESTNINWTISTDLSELLEQEIDEGEEIVRMIQVISEPLETY